MRFLFFLFGIRILNTNKLGFKKAVFRFLQINVFNASERLVWQISLKNELQLEQDIYYQSAKLYEISPKKTRENS